MEEGGGINMEGITFTLKLHEWVTLVLALWGVGFGAAWYAFRARTDKIRNDVRRLEEDVEISTFQLTELKKKEGAAKGELLTLQQNLAQVEEETEKTQRELQEQINIIRGDEGAKVRIWNYPEYYQVIVKLFQDITVDVKMQMASSNLPQPWDQHQCNIAIKPGDDDFRIMDGRRWR